MADSENHSSWLIKYDKMSTPEYSRFCGMMLQNLRAKIPTWMNCSMLWMCLPSDGKHKAKERHQRKYWHSSSVATTQKSKTIYLPFLQTSLLIISVVRQVESEV